LACGWDRLVRIELAKGRILLLTWAEYAAGLEQGKRERWRERMEKGKQKDRDD